MIPQISAFDNNVKTIVTRSYPSLTYFVNNNRITNNVDGLAAVRQAVMHILTTERYVYPIYDFNYGIELEQLKGKSITYAKAKITNIITNALTQDDRIINIIINNINISDTNILNVNFTVNTVLGDFREELDFEI